MVVESSVYYLRHGSARVWTTSPTNPLSVTYYIPLFCFSLPLSIIPQDCMIMISDTKKGEPIILNFSKNSDQHCLIPVPTPESNAMPGAWPSLIINRDLWPELDRTLWKWVGGSGCEIIESESCREVAYGANRTISLLYFPLCLFHLLYLLVINSQLRPPFLREGIQNSRVPPICHRMFMYLTFP